MAFWSLNISGTGRFVRILSGIIFLAAAVVVYLEGGVVLPWILGVVGAFAIFEGVFGWCLIRACGIKTRF
jgi:hypothetical protein